ncbi:RAM signaling pathway protein-domain-containing protein [Mycena rebaudengoi]|nr:RAM signaling pathway protein-domain-containing protein [Mycena rebaudengoi]
MSAFAGPKRLSFSPPSLSLSSEQISDALANSADAGATLVFLKQNLSDIGEEAAEELATIGRETPDDECSVERIALGHNRLTTLPTAFALLSRLRYLNLKSNSFVVFPDVLTLLPALDTLDLSHNKIKRLPTQPGKLLNLRVFSLARNKLIRLPIYLSKFYKLDVLQLERNPIEWPPKSVLAVPENSEGMRDWIRSVQKWIEVETSRPRIHDDSGFSEQELESHIEDSYNSWSGFPPVSEKEFDAGVTPHARSFSIDSNFSVSSLAESEPAQEDVRTSTYGQAERPPPLHLGILGSYSAENSPTHSFDSYLPSPADSDKSFDEPLAQHQHHPPRMDSLRNPPPDPPPDSTAHARNASYASGTRSRERTHVPGKKSMPDLRTAKLNFSRKVPDLPQGAKNLSSLELSFPSPMSLRKDSDSSGSSSAIIRPFTRDPTQTSPTRGPASAAVPSMTFERNSYFRRLSTLPTASISNTVPKALLSLIDTARSILFAMCQVYQTLEHYTIHAPDDRLKSVLRKVLDPAGADMMQLINALDRFDAMSRKMLPPHAVCRGVVESCRDTVASFGKAISVLSLQLKFLASADDVRYLRTMLLLMYGSTAEVAVAWQGMIPQIELIRPLLHPKIFPIPSPNGAADQPHFLSSEHSPPPALRSNGGRTRTARRHAGSFSIMDVEIGKKLPSYDDVPLMSGGVVSGVATYTPTPRAPKRHLGGPFSGGMASGPSPPSPMPSWASASSVGEGSSRGFDHSRQGSQASLQASASSSSASMSNGVSSVAASVASSPSIPAAKTSFLELPSSSKTQVDKEALQAVQAAVDVAPAVWDMMEQTLGEVLESKADVRESLERARAVTRRLADIIRTMQEGGELAVDRKVLREDAHLFLKTVVQLSNVIKTYGGAASSTLRTNLVKLTNSTEEFAILLHVSSFSPAPTNGRSYSPMPSSPKLGSPALSSNSAFSHPMMDDYRMGSSLSRSRSAQPSASSKLGPPASQEQPRSALPLQSFKVPPVRQGRLAVREAG